MICVVELDPIPVHQADGHVRTKCGDGELIQEILPDLASRLLLINRFNPPRLFG